VSNREIYSVPRRGTSTECKCGGTITVPRDGPPLVDHTLPPCRDFLEMEVDRFLEMVNRHFGRVPRDN